MKIEPSEREIAKGDTDEVDVFIEGVTNPSSVGAFEFKLNYDETVVIIAAETHVQLGAFLGSTGRTAESPEDAPIITNGVVLYGAFSYGDNPGPDDNGSLATITFTAQNIGSTTLSLTDVKVTDIDGNLITLESVIDGQITVLDKAAPAPNEILSVSASLTQLDITSQVADDDTPPVFYRLDGQFFDGDSWIDDGGVSDYSYSTLRPAPFSDTGLLENGLYRYGQQVKDSASPPNESNWPPDEWFLKATLLNPPETITFPEVELYETGMHVSVPTPPKPSAGGSSGVEDQTGAYFDIITGEGEGPGAIDRDWADDYTAEYTNLLANTQYGWKVKYRNYEGVETAFTDPEEERYTLIEAPTGIVFPYATSSTIELQAQGNFPNLTADDSGIYFDSLTEGGDEGINEWIQLTSDTATGLLPNTQYSFQAKARNGDAVATGFGPSANKYTLANEPSAPTVGNPTQTTLDVDIPLSDNPDYTLFALYNKTSDYYVDEDGGNNGSIPVWLTESQWGIVTVVNLAPDTTYEFRVTAKNGEGIETTPGPTGSGKTLEAAVDTLPPTPNQISVSAMTTQLDVISQEAIDDTPPVFYRLDGQFFDGDSWIDDGGVSDYSYSTLRPAPFSDTGLLENGLYRYGQQVKDSASPPNESNWPPDEWFLKATLLNPPETITISNVSETGMDVSVPTPPQPSGAGQTGAYIVGPGGDPPGIWDDYTRVYTNLLPNTLYEFHAKYRNYEGIETDFGPTASKYTLAQIPSAPTVENPTQTTLDVDIPLGDNPDYTLFALYNKTSAYYVDEDGGNNGSIPVWLTDSQWGTVTVVALAPDTEYEFQVKAKNGEDIETDFGSAGSGKTLTVDILPPTIHQEEQEARDKQTRLKWDAVPDATGYKLYRSTTKGSGYELIADVGDETSYEDNTVTNGIKYYYVVTAYQNENDSGYSNEVSLKPPFSFYSSGQPAFFWGNATIDGNPVANGDIIAAFAEGVEIHNGCIGTFPITLPGAYGMLNAYGDDTTTLIKDGASDGDIISFQIWDNSKDEIYDLSVEGELPTWHHQTQTLVNLFYTSIFELSLAEGWNLISFPVAKCYYDPNVCEILPCEPPETGILPAGTEVVDVTTLGQSSLVEWFTSVLTATCGDWGADNPPWRMVISGLPGGPAVAMDTEVEPVINTLQFMSPGYAYWVKIKEGTCGVTLTLDGSRLACNTPLDYLQSGWNYIGYLPDVGYYDTSIPDEECLYVTPQVWEEKPAPVAEYVLSSIDDKYRLIFGACPGGEAIAHDPTIQPHFSTLHFFTVGNGYVIKLTEDAILTYPCDAVSSTTTVARRLVRKPPAQDGVIPTDRMMFLYGTVSIDGKPAKAGSRISVFTANGLPCGFGKVLRPGVFGFLPVYGDDVTTAEIDGARPGEDLLLTVNGKPATSNGSNAAGGTKLRWLGQHAVQKVTLTVTTNPPPTRFDVGQNHPNPFNPETWIPYKLPEAAAVKVEIYSLKGQVVRTLNLGPKNAGVYHTKGRAAYWDGRNDDAEPVSSGVYFYRLTAGTMSQTKRMVLIK